MHMLTKTARYFPLAKANEGSLPHQNSRNIRPRSSGQIGLQKGKTPSNPSTLHYPLTYVCMPI